MGAKFYRDEFDYLSADERSLKDQIKGEAINITLPSTSCSNIPARSLTKGRKRPRRSAAAAVQSYIVPDSDEDAMSCDKVQGKTAILTVGQTKDGHLRQWMSHLNDLLRSEQRKVRSHLNLHQLIRS
jgi:hypothetical protein